MKHKHISFALSFYGLTDNSDISVSNVESSIS